MEEREDEYLVKTFSLPYLCPYFLCVNKVNYTEFRLKLGSYHFVTMTFPNAGIPYVSAYLPSSWPGQKQQQETTTNKGGKKNLHKIQ